MTRLEAEVFEPVAVNGFGAAQRSWRGQRHGRIARGQHAAPERREHPQAATFLVADLARCDEEVTPKALRADADMFESGPKLLLDGVMRRLCDLVPEHRACTSFARDVGNDLCRWTAPQHQTRPPGL